jgi:F-type H+-transporting ATPase subunit b
MLIDWFTVGAQLINFLVLVWLLKRFLYKPVLKAIDTREKRIAEKLADAEARKAEALKQRDEFQAKNKEFDEQRAALMTRAVLDAKAEQARLLDGMRLEAQSLRLKHESALRSEWTALRDSITHRATAEVFEIARKALSDLASASLEERMSVVFTRRLRELDPKSKETLGTALRISTAVAVVRSTFDLGTVERAAIQSALNVEFSTEVHLQFETTPEGVCGIELTLGGQRVSWNIAEYISSLKREMEELVSGDSAPDGAQALQGPPAETAVLSVA